MRINFRAFSGNFAEAWFCLLLGTLVMVAPAEGIRFQIGFTRYYDLPVAVDLSSGILLLLGISLLAALGLNRSFIYEFGQSIHRINHKLGGWWCFLWLGWMLIGVVWSSQRESVLMGWLYSLGALIVALLVAHLISKGWQKYLVFSIGISALVEELIATGQYFQRGAVGLTWLNEPTRFLIEDGVIFRSHGLVGHPNPLAFFLMIALFVLFSYGASVRHWSISLAAAFIFLGMLYTGSRTNFASFLLAMCLCALYLLTRIKLRYTFALSVAAPIMVLLAIQMLPASLMLRYERLPRGEINSRITWAYGDTLAIVEQHPIRGIGTDTLLIETYKRAGDHYVPLAHNVLLILWAEQGIIGVILYGVIILCFLKRLHPRSSLPEFILTAGFLAMIAASLFDMYFNFPHFRTLMLWYWGYVWGVFLLRESNGNIGLRSDG